MSLINWNKNYSVGVIEFDTQHKILIDLINKLHDSMKAGAGNTALAEILNELVNYTKIHFSNEEKHFAQFGYPETATHKIEHEKLTKQVLDFQKEYLEGKASMSIDVMNFLRDWLLEHIGGVDKKYTAFFNSKGIR